ncbi:MAG: chemotaxis protein CheW [Candidatus Methanogasteraceae archaeon]
MDEADEAIRRQSDEAILVIFTLDSGLYGVDVSQVREITNMRDTTPVPNTSHYVDGVTNLRGQVTTVTDLRRKFGLPEKDKDDRSRMIIVEPDGVPVGMVVDSVSEVLRMPTKEIEAIPEILAESAAGADIDSEYIKGVGKLDGGELLILLDLEKVVAAA